MEKGNLLVQKAHVYAVQAVPIKKRQNSQHSCAEQQYIHRELNTIPRTNKTPDNKWMDEWIAQWMNRQKNLHILDTLIMFYLSNDYCNISHWYIHVRRTTNSIHVYTSVSRQDNKMSGQQDKQYHHCKQTVVTAPLRCKFFGSNNVVCTCIYVRLQNKNCELLLQ